MQSVPEKKDATARVEGLRKPTKESPPLNRQ